MRCVHCPDLLSFFDEYVPDALAVRFGDDFSYAHWQIECLGDAAAEAREVVRTAEMVKRSSHGGSLAIGPNRERQAMEEPRKLYRSRSQRMVAGVCGGLAEYFNVDATLIRVLFLVLAVVGGSGLVIYLLMWIIVPDARKIPPPT
jgi:phage shock protein C